MNRGTKRLKIIKHVPLHNRFINTYWFLYKTSCISYCMLWIQNRIVVWIVCRDCAVRIRREQRQSPFRWKARKQAQQESERCRKKNSLLTAFVERTDVINLYGRGTVLYKLSHSLLMPFVCRWQCYVKRKAWQVKDDLIETPSHLLMDVISNSDCLSTGTHLFGNKYLYLLE
jgi:hypothetical protein